MIDGLYQFEMDTPFGRKPGSVNLRTEGDVIYADIDAPLIGKQSLVGAITGDAFSSQGSLKVKLIGKVDYSLSGTVVDDDLRLSINTNKGDFELVGKRA